MIVVARERPTPSMIIGTSPAMNETSAAPARDRGHRLDGPEAEVAARLVVHREQPRGCRRSAPSADSRRRSRSRRASSAGGARRSRASSSSPSSSCSGVSARRSPATPRAGDDVRLADARCPRCRVCRTPPSCRRRDAGIEGQILLARQLLARTRSGCAPPRRPRPRRRRR